jgi:hypothetical protein
MSSSNDRAAASGAARPGNDQPDEAEQAGTATQPAGDEPAKAQPGEDQEAELERLRTENAKLREQAGAGRRRHFSWRTPVSIVLIVLGCVLPPRHGSAFVGCTGRDRRVAGLPVLPRTDLAPGDSGRYRDASAGSCPG